MRLKIIVNEAKKKIVPVVWFGEESQITYDVELTSSGAEVQILMLLIGKRKCRADVRVNVIHRAIETKSEVVMKGVLYDQSRVDFEGMVKIGNGARDARAELTANLLLLGGGASGRVVPNLEIMEDEVVAEHKATVGKVSELELYYLMSRGLPKARATEFLVRGFLKDLLDKYPPGEVKDLKNKLIWM